MPELGNQLLDVLLGLALIFLVLSLLCSLLQEVVATAFSWRARFLERGIRSMLDGDDTRTDDAGALSRAVTESAFVREKLRKRRLLGRQLRVPPYLPSTTFARALIETARSERWPAELPDDVERKLSELMQEAEGDVQRLKSSLEDWYDATMQRVSAWYKRRARIWLFGFGVIVAGVAHADIIDVSERLWRDDAVRTAVARQADRVAQAQSAEALRGDVRAEIERTGDTLAAVKQFELPVGWNESNGEWSALTLGATGRGEESAWTWLLGILLTAAALSFGAPFWFDVLSRATRVRGGRPPPRQ
jgi:hypothetical protein